MITDWSIPGSDGQPILGDTHMPSGAGVVGRGVIVVAHGFKGYKDYGMFPRLAREFAAAGLIAHRFNFSHSGMTNNFATFERPDLFERDTWRKQVFDLMAVIAAIEHGELAGGRGGPGLPLFVLGHSRGGITAILTAGDLTYLNLIPDADDALHPATHSRSGRIAGVITLAAPASCNPLTPDQEQELLEQGWIESPSSRTGQKLRVGRAFLREQLDDQAGHDVLAHVARLANRGAMLIIHGDSDPSVPVQSATQIAATARAAGGHATLCIVPGADHVFNTPNPLPEEQPTCPQLQRVIDETLKFVRETAPLPT